MKRVDGLFFLGVSEADRCYWTPIDLLGFCGRFSELKMDQQETNTEQNAKRTDHQIRNAQERVFSSDPSCSTDYKRLSSIELSHRKC